MKKTFLGIALTGFVAFPAFGDILTTPGVYEIPSHRFGSHPTHTDGTVSGDPGVPLVISGWSWLNHAGYIGHVDSPDWLFTIDDIVTPPSVTVVPKSANITLFGLGLAGMLIRRKRRS